MNECTNDKITKALKKAREERIELNRMQEGMNVNEGYTGVGEATNTVNSSVKFESV
jgi:hypothetical protein